MKHMKIWMAVCLLGLTVACSKGMKDRLFGSNDTTSATETGTADAKASSVDDQLMQKVAMEISQDILGTGKSGMTAPQSAACIPGSVTTSSSTVTYPPQVNRSSSVYTVNGVTYFSGNYYESSGGTLVTVKEMNGTCLTNSSIYGTLSVQGSSYMQWGGTSTPWQYQYYYYKYKYNYKGDILEIDGEYTIGSDKGTTVYPLHYTISI